MFKFFRQLRQNLLSENKFSKYLLYAFGEIILVVIGILIALQINNYNESKKSAVQERLYLNRLLLENKEDLQTFSTFLSDLNLGIQSIKDLSVAINDVTMSDTQLVNKANDYFKYGSIYPIFTSSTSTFDDLSSTGNLKVIRNSNLRDQLVKHYAKHKHAAERIRIGADWALPVDAPFTYDHSIMRLEPGSSFLFGKQDIAVLAKELRQNSDAYLNNAAVHYWIDLDAIDQINRLKEATILMVAALEEELKQP